MTLTVGATLQDGKYAIQAMLNQSDFGVTYLANHTLLEQPVILQTLNESLRHHKQFAQLQQQFITAARKLANGQQFDSGRVLDCFVEADMPFVVLERNLGQVPPKVNDWLLPELNHLVLLANAPAPVIQSSALHPLPAVTNGSQPLPTLTANYPLSPQPPELHQGAAIAAAPIPTFSQKGTGKPGKEYPDGSFPGSGARSPRSKSKSNRWIPLALLVTSMIAGLAGASFGWVLRFGNPGGDSSGSPLFGSEQSFPSLESWPGPSPYEAGSWNESAPDELTPSDSSRDQNNPPAPRRRTVIPDVAPSSPLLQEKPPASDIPLQKTAPSFDAPAPPDPAPLPSPADSSVPPTSPVPPASDSTNQPPKLPPEPASEPPAAVAPEPPATNPLPPTQ